MFSRARKGRPRPSEEIEGMKTTSLYSGFGPARAYGEDRRFSQPDALLNDQYLENFRSKAPLEGERALLLAVLEDGVGCFQDNVLPRNRKKQMLLEEAREWFFNDDSDWLFSFRLGLRDARSRTRLHPPGTPTLAGASACAITKMAPLSAHAAGPGRITQPQ
jgi:hypothetical protein